MTSAAPAADLSKTSLAPSLVAGQNPAQTPAPTAAAPATPDQKKVDDKAKSVLTSTPATPTAPAPATPKLFTVTTKTYTSPAKPGLIDYKDLYEKTNATLTEKMAALAKATADLETERKAKQDLAAQNQVLATRARQNAISAQLNDTQKGLAANQEAAAKYLIKGEKVEDGQVLTDLLASTKQHLASFKTESGNLTDATFVASRDAELANGEQFRVNTNNAKFDNLQNLLFAWLADGQETVSALLAYAADVSTLEGELKALYQDPTKVSVDEVKAKQAKIDALKTTRDGIKAKELMDVLVAGINRDVAADLKTNLDSLKLASKEESAEYETKYKALFAKEKAICQEWSAFVANKSNDARQKLCAAEAFLESIRQDVFLTNPLTYIVTSLGKMPQIPVEKKPFDQQEHDAALAVNEKEFMKLLAPIVASQNAYKATVDALAAKIAEEKTPARPSKATDMQHLFVDEKNPKNKKAVEALAASIHSDRLGKLTATQDKFKALITQLDNSFVTVAATLDHNVDASKNNGTFNKNRLFPGFSTPTSTKYRDMVAAPSKDGTIEGLDKVDWIVDDLKPLKALIDSTPAAPAAKKDEPTATTPAQTEPVATPTKA